MLVLMKTLICSSLLLLSTALYANEANVVEQLKKYYPNLKVKNIQKTEVTGFYSALLDGKVVYVDEKAEHLFAGNLLRLKDQKNLTKALVVKDQVFFKSLPLENAIKVVKGTGEHQLIVFSDPNCPYCKKLDKELNQLNNVTIYTFLYPVLMPSIVPAKKVWCSQNREIAWHLLIRQRVIPSVDETCQNPIQENLVLGKKLGIEGTPGLIFADGFQTAGFHTALEIEQIWQERGL